MSATGQGRPMRSARAVGGSGAARMRAITSSMLATATTRPTRMCARSRALARSKAVRRVIISSRKARKASSTSLRVSCSGRPPRRATMLTPKLCLQRRELVELVEDDVGVGLALDLDHDPDAVPVALVADLGDALDPLLAHHLGDALDHLRLVDQVGHLGDDDGGAVCAPPRTRSAPRTIRPPRPVV